MLPRLGQLLSIIALFAICGGHWAILQTVAWTQMLRDYSEESGIVVAIQQTFSGERPCTMCKTISSERQKESQLPASVNLAKKFELILFALALAIAGRVARPNRFIEAALGIFFTRSEAPPSPVPLALA